MLLPARLLKEEKGMAGVLVAVFLLIAFGISALVADAGLLFFQKSQLANTCDAAALAGVQELPASPVDAEIVAREYVAKNGMQPVNFAFLPSNDSHALTVRGREQVSLFFARIWGMNSSWVDAEATARVEGAIEVTGVVPLGIEKGQFVKGTTYTLKVGSPPVSGAGNFGALDMGGSGADKYRENLQWGYNQVITVGDILNTETGNLSGPTRQAIDDRMARCPHVPQCTVEEYVRDCPRIVVVPVYEPCQLEENQIKQVRIVGFAAFLLTGETDNGVDSYVSGCFIDQVVEGTCSGSQQAYGAYVARLVR